MTITYWEFGRSTIHCPRCGGKARPRTRGRGWEGHTWLCSAGTCPRFIPTCSGNARFTKPRQVPNPNPTRQERRMLDRLTHRQAQAWLRKWQRRRIKGGK